MTDNDKRPLIKKSLIDLMKKVTGQTSEAKTIAGVIDDFSAAYGEGSGNGGGRTQLSYPNNYYFMEDDEADIILKLSDFTFENKGGNHNCYVINLSSEQINGKKVKFYYDENDLTPSITDENYLLFEVELDKPITLPTHIFMSYNGGVKDNSNVSISISEYTENVTVSPLSYVFNEIKDKNELRLIPNSVGSSSAGANTGYNVQCFFCLGTPINIVYVSDPNS